ncbi:MAG TPA: class III cytochrome c [Thermosulfurimonas dismutans]|uniref:Class III cytochrome c n=1 Tax=Thermosulfurimonas dismutans TaxID=999894 RepID=A0A7C3CT74_9BACT|nr:class III cytochrome c [Thermosulfurimonas dismutans]
MRKWVVMLGVMGLILGVYGVGTGSCNEGPKVIKLPAPKMAHTTVVFPHWMHQNVLKGNCGECHHSRTADWKQVPYKKGMKIQKCDTCHNKQHPNPKLRSVKNAMHINCRGCHKAMKKEGKKTGPTGCFGCHKKK